MPVNCKCGWTHDELAYPDEQDGFMECSSCREKSGSPALCMSCLHNRGIIAYYKAKAKYAGLEKRADAVIAASREFYGYTRGMKVGENGPPVTKNLQKALKEYDSFLEKSDDR